MAHMPNETKYAESIVLALGLLTERFSKETDGFLSISGQDLQDRLITAFSKEELDEMSRHFVENATVLDKIAKIIE